MSSESSSQDARAAGIKAALASTASRTLALYFSRPIRLFRPSKISGWHLLRGQSLPLLIKQNGWLVIPKHFLPPLIVNALLGTILWTTYSEAGSRLVAHGAPLSSTGIAAVSGGCAGAAQALAAAPAENVRIVLEGGRVEGSWAVAWREVFAGTESLRSLSPNPAQHRDEVRRVRHWLRDVRGMAGRGWQGLGFGVAKDSLGFAVFFTIFDVSRRAAAQARLLSDTSSSQVSPGTRGHVPRIVHGTTIVAGGMLAGLSYELVCRPFDAARRSITIAAAIVGRGGPSPSLAAVLADKVREEGVSSFFRNPAYSYSLSSPSSPTSRLVNAWLRTLARFGPWGVAFLAWETFGPDV